MPDSGGEIDRADCHCSAHRARSLWVARAPGRVALMLRAWIIRNQIVGSDRLQPAGSSRHLWAVHRARLAEWGLLVKIWIERHELVIAIVGFAFFLAVGVAMILWDGGVGAQ
jgi:hypothetical protein